jgi:hypothetical protein
MLLLRGGLIPCVMEVSVTYHISHPSLLWPTFAYRQSTQAVILKTLNRFSTVYQTLHCYQNGTCNPWRASASLMTDYKHTLVVSQPTAVSDLLLSNRTGAQSQIRRQPRHWYCLSYIVDDPEPGQAHATSYF